VTLTEARLELATLCGQDVYPALTDDELITILGRVKLVDTVGYAPSDTGWVGAYDLAQATVAACLLHATKAAADAAFSNVAGRVEQQQVIQNWRVLANEARRGVLGTIGGHALTMIDGVVV